MGDVSSAGGPVVLMEDSYNGCNIDVAVVGDRCVDGNETMEEVVWMPARIRIIYKK